MDVPGSARCDNHRPVARSCHLRAVPLRVQDRPEAGTVVLGQVRHQHPGLGHRHLRVQRAALDQAHRPARSRLPGAPPGQAPAGAHGVAGAGRAAGPVRPPCPAALAMLQRPVSGVHGLRGGPPATARLRQRIAPRPIHPNPFPGCDPAGRWLRARIGRISSERPRVPLSISNVAARNPGVRRPRRVGCARYSCIGICQQAGHGFRGAVISRGRSTAHSSLCSTKVALTRLQMKTSLGRFLATSVLCFTST